jgi:PAS domain S-box-containing protein
LKKVDSALPVRDPAFEEVLDAVPDGIVIVGADGRIASANRQALWLSGYNLEELLGMPVEDLVPEGLRSRHLDHRRAYQGHPAVRPMGTHLDIRFRRKDGSEFPADIALSPLEAAGGRFTVASVRDITERKRQDDRLRALLEVAQMILEGRDDETVLRLVASRARSLAEADLAAVAVADGEAFVVRSAEGRQARAVQGLRIPLGGTLTGSVASSGQPVVLSGSSPEPAPADPMLHAAGVGPALMVPLESGGRRLGALTIANQAGGREFGQPDLRLLELFAAQAAVAIDYARARDEVQRLAVLADRERIGRELHDGAIQALFAVGMGLQAMAMSTDDAPLRGRLEATVAQIDEVIRDLRNYIFGLRPSLAADRHLDSALQELAEQLEQQHGVACAVDVDPALASRLAGRAADLVQLTREALSNVGRHAAATTCRISLRPAPGVAVLEIEDDGRGFVPDSDHGTGWGLRNLEERAGAIGGALEIVSVPGEGTTVRLTIPL